MEGLLIDICLIWLRDSKTIYPLLPLSFVSTYWLQWLYKRYIRLALIHFS